MGSREKSREVPRKAAETGKENAAPTSGEGAGASWADTDTPPMAVAANTTATIKALFIL